MFTPQSTYMGLTIIPTHKAITLHKKIKFLAVPSSKEKKNSIIPKNSCISTFLGSFFFPSFPQLYETDLGSTQESFLLGVCLAWNGLKWNTVLNVEVTLKNGGLWPLNSLTMMNSEASSF